MASLSIHSERRFDNPARTPIRVGHHKTDNPLPYRYPKLADFNEAACRFFSDQQGDRDVQQTIREFGAD